MPTSIDMIKEFGDLSYKAVVFEREYSFPEKGGEGMGNTVAGEKIHVDTLVMRLQAIINSWETRAIEAEKAPKEYVRGISSGMKICVEELLKEIWYA